MTIERYNYNDEPSGSETIVQALERCERHGKDKGVLK